MAAGRRHPRPSIWFPASRRGQKTPSGAVGATCSGCHRRRRLFEFPSQRGRPWRRKPDDRAMAAAAAWLAVGRPRGRRRRRRRRRMRPAGGLDCARAEFFRGARAKRDSPGHLGRPRRLRHRCLHPIAFLGGSCDGGGAHGVVHLELVGKVGEGGAKINLREKRK